MDTNKSIAEQMVNAFQGQNVTVSEGTFFGMPIREYFGEPQVNENAAGLPAEWQVSHEAAEQMVAEITRMGAKQETPTFFGVPIAEYFGRAEENIWQKILADVGAMKPAAVAS